MHRHDAHFVPRLLQVALDLGAAPPHPMQKALQRRRMIALEREGQIEKLVDRIGRLGAEPRQHAGAPRRRAERFGEKLEGRHEIGAGPCRTQIVERRAEIITLAPACPKRLPKACLAPRMGKVEQRIFIKADERAFEHTGEGQVVRRQQHEIGQRHQVHHGELRAHRHAVHARDRHVTGLQRPHELIDKGRAPAHQHHDIAGLDAPGMRGQPSVIPRLLPRVDPSRDALGQNLREHLRRVGVGAGHFGDVPAALGILVGRHDGGPKLDPPGLAGARRGMADHLAARAHVAAHLFGGENRIHRFQHRLGRAEGIVERDRVPHLARVPGLLLEIAAHFVQCMRVGTLEAEDRLFLVAHNEQRAGCFTRTFAAEKLVRQRRDHTPLLRAGILRFVDQQMVEPAVDLVEHPGRDAWLGEQRAAPLDLIAEIERRAVLFLFVVKREQRGAEADERFRGLGRPRGFHPVQHVQQACLLGQQGVERVRRPISNFLGCQGFFRLVFLGDENLEVSRETLRPARFVRF